MSYLRLSFITSVILLLTACGSSRKTSQSVGAGQYAPVENADTAAGGLRWTDLRIPVSVNIEKPRSFRVGGTMTMVKDKSIHISLRFFGMEMAAAYVTSDSVFAYAKMQRVYVAESIRDALGGINASVGDVQSLLLGCPVSLPGAAGGASIEISELEATGQPLSIAVSHLSGRTASLVYTPLESLPLAQALIISASSGNKEIAASMEYDWSKAEVDKGNDRPFSIPRNYQRIKGSALLRSLTRL